MVGILSAVVTWLVGSWLQCKVWKINEPRRVFPPYLRYPGVGWCSGWSYRRASRSVSQESRKRETKRRTTRWRWFVWQSGAFGLPRIQRHLRSICTFVSMSMSWQCEVYQEPIIAERLLQLITGRCKSSAWWPPNTLSDAGVANCCHCTVGGMARIASKIFVYFQINN